MLQGIIIGRVSREPKSGVGKNNKEYCFLSIDRKVQFGDKTYTRYYSANFGFGAAVKNAARCQVGDTVAVAFDDIQADTYEKDGKTKASIKLNGVSVTVLTGESSAPTGDDAPKPSAADREWAQRTGQDSGGAKSPAVDDGGDIPFMRLDVLCQ